MSNNNAAEAYNGVKTVTTSTAAVTTAAAATTTTLATTLVDTKLLDGTECDSNGTASSINLSEYDTVSEGGIGGDSGAAAVDEHCKEAAACNACTGFASVACCVGVSDNCDDGAASWLAMQMYATNNNLITASAASKTTENSENRSQQQLAINKWWMDTNGIVHKYNTTNYLNASCQINDKGGGRGLEHAACLQQTMIPESTRQELAESMPPVDLDYEYAMAAAAILTPTENNSHSNRTSLNNSTENLSYNSDNYYGDDIILLDEDIDADEVSLNSDDCIYAYRGDGDELELAVLDAKNVKPSEDETDFLEMDFEPDPLSEVEYGDGNSGIFDNDGGSNGTQLGEQIKSHANALLLQRNSCHISSSNGRHSANMDMLIPTHIGNTTAMQSVHATQEKRQHYSSPTDELKTQTTCLQTQTMLSKNLARISLHLDQINGEASDNLDIVQSKDYLSVDTGDMLHGGIPESTAHSLPSTLNAFITRETQEDINNATAKITGAKPKRLSRFSSTSSTCSKTSTKSRNSLRSALTPAICASVSFDERSVSCNDFRSTPLGTDVGNMPNGTNVQAPDLVNNIDDTCLDCLENEFLASTIGKVLDTNKCMKCYKRRQNMSFYTRLNSEPRCRSGSPTYMLDYDYQRDDMLFDEFSVSTCKQWIVQPVRQCNSNVYNKVNNDCIAADELNGDNLPNNGRVHLNQINLCMEGGIINQRRKQRDSYKAEQQLLKNHLMTEREIKITTVDLTEDMLVQALDKLNVSYNIDLIRSHFAARANCKEFKNLLQFLLHESMKNCDYPKLKRLINLATKKQIEITFKEDTTVAEPEVVNVKVTDILQQWTSNKNLALLKRLDKRFMDANIMGKIANIIRQTQQQQQARAPTKRPLLDYLKIPQYYPSGHLILHKKC